MTRLVGRDIVCFSNDWDGDPLSKTHLMRLAARENRVLWVNSLGNRAPRPTTRDVQRLARKLRGSLGGIREVERNIHVLSPLAVPVYGSTLISAANGHLVAAQVRHAMARLHMSNPVVWAFLPAAAPAVERLNARLTVYHCVDEFSAFGGAPAAEIASMERQLMAHADLVIVSSERLLASKTGLHPRVVLVRHGVDHAHFSRALDPALPVHPLVRGLPRPVLGFMGLVAEWVDQDLLAALADHFNGGTVVVIGKEDADTAVLKARRNVVRLGRRPYAELPSLLKGLDVALLPFVDNELTQASNPLKVREYLAAGLPVVSTPVPEVVQLGLARIAPDPAGFIAAIDELMTSGPGPARERSEAVRRESWTARWDECARHAGELLAEIEGTRRWSA